MKPVVYLAGSIRDGVEEDIEWRTRAINALNDVASVISPLAGKHHDEGTGKWSIYGEFTSDSQYIVHADFWAVDRADIILFNFISLAEGYPSIGTLAEFGRSTARSILRLAAVPKDYAGHENLRHFKGLHPFISENCAKVFEGIDSAIRFARNYCRAVGGHAHYNYGTVIRDLSWLEREGDND